MFTLKSILENKGATISKAGEAVDFKQGYQVSLQDMEIIKVKDLRKRHLKELLSQLNEGLCLGVWIDGGLAYIDQSARITNKHKAVKLGKAYKQISIWNWQTKQAVYL